MAIEIRLAKSSEERRAAFQLRYDVYISEMNQCQKYADHEQRTIEEPLDRDGHVFVAIDEGRVVGTVRVNLTRECDAGYYTELYAMEELRPYFPYCTSFTTKLMVLPEYRGSTIVVRLAMAAFQFGMEHDVQYDLIDCDPELVFFYKGLGYVVHAGEFHHPELGRKISLVLDLHDSAHLERTRSPFRRCTRSALRASRPSMDFLES